MYDEKFPIEDNSTTAAAIDDVYGLTDVMPGCKIHLSKVPNAERFKLIELDPSDPEWMDPFVPEEPEGTFLKLEKDTTYYVYVVQDASQEAKDRAAMQERNASQLAKEKLAFDARAEAAESGIAESCSCIYGTSGTAEWRWWWR